MAHVWMYDHYFIIKNEMQHDNMPRKNCPNGPNAKLLYYTLFIPITCQGPATLSSRATRHTWFCRSEIAALQLHMQKWIIFLLKTIFCYLKILNMICAKIFICFCINKYYFVFKVVYFKLKSNIYSRYYSMSQKSRITLSITVENQLIKIYFFTIISMEILIE